ncbi:MAG TPA: hypothetical protein VGY32_06640 [Solirubrobacteraceae bacterium]|nr:hypothetical protein [Solirubrobacteraceae bacterium]
MNPRQIAVALVCCVALGVGCGSNTNPTVGSGDFISYCQHQPQNAQAGLDCRCVQQKLEAAGYGGKPVNDPSVKEAPATLIEPCVTGGGPAQSTPATPSTTT